MFEKEKIDLIYRIICLISFCLVALLVNSFVTLILLILFFYLMVKKTQDFSFLAVVMITFLFLGISVISQNYTLLRIMIMIDYAYYFLYIPSISTMVNKTVDKVYDKKHNISEQTDEEYMRFKKKTKKRVIKNNLNLPGTFYLTFHLAVLFLLIMVGSCVI